LPLADREGVEVVRLRTDLVVTVGSYRRVIALPAMLSRMVVTGARLQGGSLQVAFGPDERASRSTTRAPAGTGDCASSDSPAVAAGKAG
jgi:arsenite-transporting ATPase